MDHVAASLQVEANFLREFAVVFDEENETAAWLRSVRIQYGRRRMIVHRSGAILCFAFTCVSVLPGKTITLFNPTISLGKGAGELENLCEPFLGRNVVSYHGVTKCPSTRFREAVDTYS
jgi:hypothetical protein